MRSDKKTALVTGASSGIGRAVADMLFEQGFDVIGIGRVFREDACWEQKVLDITDTSELTLYIKTMLKERDVQVLVNSAGVGYYGLAEDIAPGRIAEIIRTNLEAPAVLCSLVMKSFKEKKDGLIVNVSSVTSGKSNPHGAVYGASKAGLSSLSASLFAEARKYDVRVVDICPDMTDTELYRNADFTADTDDVMAYLKPQDVAEAVKDVLCKRRGVVVNKITIVPQHGKIKRKTTEDK